MGYRTKKSSEFARLFTPKKLLGIGVVAGLMVTTTVVAQAHERVTVPTASTQSVGLTVDPAQPQTNLGADSVWTWQGRRITLPAAVSPPVGSRLFNILQGKGVLVYTCVAGVFVLTEPAIGLSSLGGQPVGIHFAPVAGLLPWESTVDGSRVDAAIVREIPTPGTVTRVLLRAVNVNGGRGMFGRTAFIVRLPVTGGVPPFTCTIPGRRIGVPFRTIYLFFRATTTVASVPNTMTNVNPVPGTVATVAPAPVAAPVVAPAPGTMTNVNPVPGVVTTVAPTPMAPQVPAPAPAR
jgi:hypothetical protein